MSTEPQTAISLVPRLVVADPDSVAAFSRDALDAEIGPRFELPDGTVTNIDVTIGSIQISLTSAVEGWGLDSPDAASPVLLRLTVPDARLTRDRMVDAGARELVPVEDRPYGRCEGRVQDPAGHLWIVSHVTEDLTGDEIRTRLAHAHGKT